jgi:hypothetical protein
MSSDQDRWRTRLKAIGAIVVLILLIPLLSAVGESVQLRTTTTLAILGAAVFIVAPVVLAVRGEWTTACTVFGVLLVTVVVGAIYGINPVYDALILGVVLILAGPPFAIAIGGNTWLAPVIPALLSLGCVVGYLLEPADTEQRAFWLVSAAVIALVGAIGWGAGVLVRAMRGRESARRASGR